MRAVVLKTIEQQSETAGTLVGPIEKLAAAEPDVLLMDLRLPELNDGLALIRRAREISPAKIVVLSGWLGDLESRPEQQFVHRVLAKPVRANTLQRHITELV